LPGCRPGQPSRSPTSPRQVSRGTLGAFSYPFFETFHTALIQHHFDEGVIQLLRVKAGQQTVGVLYNFIHSNEVLVYQTGSNYVLVESKNKQSPGLLTHTLAVEQNNMLGYRRYDFLAGDALYKRVLSNGSEQLWWGTVQRGRIKFRLENVARKAWKRISACRAGIRTVIELAHMKLLLTSSCARSGSRWWRTS
jgi:CelD/BcsL family acetyltransferase involved in cellulose biosynthesis